MNSKIAVAAAVILLAAGAAFAAPAESWINEPDAPVQVFGEYEGGFFGVTGHTIQIGIDGNEFNYVTEGGQDVLLPFSRFTLGATLYDRHRVSFLYQPLEVNTTVRYRENRTINDVTFPEGTAVDMKYGFPFYRVSYSYDVLEDPHRVLGFGAAIQIRNASIVFQADNNDSTADDLLTVSQNVGIVPALHLYSRYEFPFGLNLTADITGSYASSQFFNGASFEFEGSLLDASLRMGYQLKGNMEVFGNLRFLGGTSKGTSQFDASSWSVSEERYTANNLGTLAVTMGVTVR
ncbi:MAG: hypothetical protein K9M84_05830 [Spirochaetia bacterium]|nr:hypothetical protein [Spirochaetia bacterium]